MSMSVKRISGFSLVEILIVIVVISILVTLCVPLYGVLRAKAGSAVCISRMHLIGTGFNEFLLDHDNLWPQMPENLLAAEDEEQASRWWWSTLKPYGVNEQHWACPSDPSLPGSSEKHFVSSYLVTQFDEFPNTAFRWQQPWLIETGSYHGGRQGPNMLMPDGSIQKADLYLGPP